MQWRSLLSSVKFILRNVMEKPPGDLKLTRNCNSIFYFFSFATMIHIKLMVLLDVDAQDNVAKASAVRWFEHALRRDGSIMREALKFR